MAAPIHGPTFFAGEVIHHRLRPKVNRFRYGVFFIAVPVDAVERASRWWFGVNRPRPLSIRFRDYGPGDGTAPRIWIRALLEGEGVEPPDGEIVLQSFPRVFGFVFNPVSVWRCYDAAGELRVVLCEVNNTFGERHVYLLARPDRGPIASGESLAAPKAFHVSPFLPPEGGYRFRFRIGADRALARIDYHDASGDLLRTSVSGAARPWTAGEFARLVLRHGPMTILIVARIHWQALKLWAKRVPFFRKPQAPQRWVSR